MYERLLNRRDFPLLVNLDLCFRYILVLLIAQAFFGPVGAARSHSGGRSGGAGGGCHGEPAGPQETARGRVRRRAGHRRGRAQQGVLPAHRQAATWSRGAVLKIVVWSLFKYRCISG